MCTVSALTGAEHVHGERAHRGRGSRLVAELFVRSHNPKTVTLTLLANRDPNPDARHHSLRLADDALWLQPLTLNPKP